jgi:hypothetical protein
VCFTSGFCFYAKCDLPNFYNTLCPSGVYSLFYKFHGVFGFPFKFLSNCINIFEAGDNPRSNKDNKFCLGDGFCVFAKQKTYNGNAA